MSNNLKIFEMKICREKWRLFIIRLQIWYILYLYCCFIFTIFFLILLPCLFTAFVTVRSLICTPPWGWGPLLTSARYAMDCNVLCCIVLCCVVLCCVVLDWIGLHWLYYIALSQSKLNSDLMRFSSKMYLNEYRSIFIFFHLVIYNFEKNN